MTICTAASGPGRARGPSYNARDRHWQCSEYMPAQRDWTPAPGADGVLDRKEDDGTSKLPVPRPALGGRAGVTDAPPQHPWAAEARARAQMSGTVQVLAEQRELRKIWSMELARAGPEFRMAAKAAVAGAAAAGGWPGDRRGAGRGPCQSRFEWLDCCAGICNDLMQRRLRLCKDRESN